MKFRKSPKNLLFWLILAILQLHFLHAEQFSFQISNRNNLMVNHYVYLLDPLVPRYLVQIFHWLMNSSSFFYVEEMLPCYESFSRRNTKRSKKNLSVWRQTRKLPSNLLQCRYGMYYKKKRQSATQLLTKHCVVWFSNKHFRTARKYAHYPRLNGKTCRIWMRMRDKTYGKRARR